MAGASRSTSIGLGLSLWAGGGERLCRLLLLWAGPAACRCEPSANFMNATPIFSLNAMVKPSNRKGDLLGLLLLPERGGGLGDRPLLLPKSCSRTGLSDLWRRLRPNSSACSAVIGLLSLSRPASLCESLSLSLPIFLSYPIATCNWKLTICALDRYPRHSANTRKRIGTMQNPPFPRGSGGQTKDSETQIPTPTQTQFNLNVMLETKAWISMKGPENMKCFARRMLWPDTWCMASKRNRLGQSQESYWSSRWNQTHVSRMWICLYHAFYAFYALGFTLRAWPGIRFE